LACGCPQQDVGAKGPHRSDRLRAVAGLADDLDVALAVEDHDEARAHQFLIVHDQDTDRHRRPGSSGISACTLNPPPRRGPVVMRPPNSATRSRMPISPLPPGILGAGHG